MTSVSPLAHTPPVRLSWRRAGVRGRAWLLPPPLLLALVDFAVTLGNQHPQYWYSLYARTYLTREAAPHARWMLQGHPMAFAMGSAALLAAYALLVLLLPRRWALFVSIAAATAHASAAGSWFYLMLPAPWAYWARLALMLAAAALLLVAMERTA